MKDLDEQIEIKDKIFEVILSCTEKEQLLNTKKWIDSISRNYERVKDERIKESSQCVLKGFSNLIYSRIRKCEKREIA
jgi:hypothetical protein|nr:MAG TPA: hypothetical protein [Crassvirales sp.]